MTECCGYIMCTRSRTRNISLSYNNFNGPFGLPQGSDWAVQPTLWLAQLLVTYHVYVAAIVGGNITLLKGSGMVIMKPTIKTTLASINFHEIRQCTSHENI